ncbi:MAG TPA: PIN domain-containing protein [Thermoanaerobaculia bacterium]|nr:PIN domain-containing protein [Thermoanaerobaculia bacterium]
MEAVIYLDTHVVAWLFAGRLDLFPSAARARLEAERLLVSPMVGLELQYLFEIGRVTQPAVEVLAALEAELTLATCELAFPAIALRARDEGWTRDPFDRIIVAQAKLRPAPLLTRDETIHAHYAHAVWP